MWMGAGAPDSLQKLHAIPLYIIGAPVSICTRSRLQDRVVSTELIATEMGRTASHLGACIPAGDSVSTCA